MLSTTVAVTDGFLSISFANSGEVCCDTAFVSGVQIFTAEAPSSPSADPSCGVLSSCQLATVLPTLTIIGDIDGTGTLNYMVDGTSTYSIACFVEGNPDLITSTFGSDVSTVVVDDPTQFYWLGGVDALTIPIAIDYLASPGNKTLDVVLSQNGTECDSLTQALLATT